jgi:hypothetical protein
MELKELLPITFFGFHLITLPTVRRELEILFLKPTLITDLYLQIGEVSSCTDVIGN